MLASTTLMTLLAVVGALVLSKSSELADRDKVAFLLSTLGVLV